MDQKAIFGPFFATMLLTLVVWVYMYVRRIRAGGAGISEEFLELVRANPGGPPEGIVEVGAIFAKPGQRHQKVVDLTEPGTYGYLCPIPSPAGVPHYELGFIGVFEVAE